MELAAEMTHFEQMELAIGLTPVLTSVLLALRNWMLARNRTMYKLRRSKPAKIETALKCESITGLTRDHLTQVLATERFRSVTGLRLEKELREAIIEAHRSTKGKLTFTTFKRALPHFEVSGMRLTVKISRLDWLFSTFFEWLGCVLVILGVIAFVLTPFFETPMYPFLGVVYIFSAVFVWILNWPANSAKAIYMYLHPDSQSRHAKRKWKFGRLPRLLEKLGTPVYISFVS